MVITSVWIRAGLERTYCSLLHMAIAIGLYPGFACTVSTGWCFDDTVLWVAKIPGTMEY